MQPAPLNPQAAYWSHESDFALDAVTVSDDKVELTTESARCTNESCALGEYFDESPERSYYRLRNSIRQSLPPAMVEEIEQEIRRRLADPKRTTHG